MANTQLSWLEGRSSYGLPLNHKLAVKIAGSGGPVGTPAPAPCPDSTDGPSELWREDERLRTLRSWPAAKFLNAELAAKNGLFYEGDGRSDEVTCFFCKVKLSQWQKGDDLEADHGRWSPRCPIVQRKVGSNASTGLDECGSGPRVAHPPFSTNAARLASFRSWPARRTQTPTQLANAGFFFTGQDDQTLCFSCGGGLKDWEDEDDPWEQHTLWFSHCPFLHSAERSAALPARCGSLPSSSLEPSPVPQRDSAASAPAAPPPPPSEPAPDTPSSKLCKICYGEECNVSFVPCGHVVACMKCAKCLSACPVCRQPYTTLLKLFYS